MYKQYLFFSTGCASPPTMSLYAEGLRLNAPVDVSTSSKAVLLLLPSVACCSAACCWGMVEPMLLLLLLLLCTYIYICSIYIMRFLGGYLSHALRQWRLRFEPHLGISLIEYIILYTSLIQGNENGQATNLTEKSV